MPDWGDCDEAKMIGNVYLAKMKKCCKSLGVNFDDFENV